MEFTILPLLCGQRMAKPKSSGSFPTKIIAIEWVDNQNICRLPKTQCTFSWEKSVPNACRYQENAYLCNRNRETTVANAEIAQLVEHNLAKVRVASSSLVFRSTRTSVICSSPFFLTAGFWLVNAQVAELVDAHVSGACVERHAGSSPVLGTKVRIVQSFNQESERWRNW